MSKKKKIDEDGLERAPILTLAEKPDTMRGDESAVAFEYVLRHECSLERYLHLGQESQFAVTEEALQARKQMMQESKQRAHPETRTTRNIGMLLIGTVSQIENECRRKKVLDIGCGQGRFGEAIARGAKAEVTFFDKNPEAMENISRKMGKIVLGDGRALPFDDESFDKTFSCFSSISWAETPIETVKALNETLRVTEVGGTAFVIPAMSNCTLRDEIMRTAHHYPDDELKHTNILNYKVWALQDHVLFNAIQGLAEEGYCQNTWSGFVGRGETSGEPLQQISVMIDKKKTIPKEVFDACLMYAASFYDEATPVG